MSASIRSSNVGADCLTSTKQYKVSHITTTAKTSRARYSRLGRLRSRDLKRARIRGSLRDLVAQEVSCITQVTGADIQRIRASSGRIGPCNSTLIYPQHSTPRSSAMELKLAQGDEEFASNWEDSWSSKYGVSPVPLQFNSTGNNYTCRSEVRKLVSASLEAMLNDSDDEMVTSGYGAPMNTSVSALDQSELSSFALGPRPECIGAEDPKCSPVTRKEVNCSPQQRKTAVNSCPKRIRYEADNTPSMSWTNNVTDTARGAKTRRTNYAGSTKKSLVKKLKLFGKKIRNSKCGLKTLAVL